MLRRSRAAVITKAALLISSPARASDPAPPSSSSASSDPAPLPIAVAAVPGAVVHGAGHFVAGQPSAGRTLLALEGLGVGFTGVGLSVLAASGASRRLIAPSVALTAAGVTLFFATWFTDIYGVAMPDRARGEVAGPPPLLETSLGYRYVHDPQFAYRNFVVEKLDLRVGRLRISPEAWLSPDDANERLRGAVAVRLNGARPNGDDMVDGSYVDVEGAVVRHAYPRDGFMYWGGEASMNGRLDLGRMSPRFRGAFAEMSIGYALQSYETESGGDSADDLLLFRAAWGVYLARRGEVWIDYDHRHDSFAGGLLMSGLGSGVAGSIGVGARYFFTPELGIGADVRTGAAQVMGLSLLYRTALEDRLRNSIR